MGWASMCCTVGRSHWTITLAEVYAALAYYHANSVEIEADIIQQAAEAERIEMLHQ